MIYQMLTRWHQSDLLSAFCSGVGLLGGWTTGLLGYFQVSVRRTGHAGAEQVDGVRAEVRSQAGQITEIEGRARAVARNEHQRRCVRRAGRYRVHELLPPRAHRHVADLQLRAARRRHEFKLKFSISSSECLEIITPGVSDCVLLDPGTVMSSLETLSMLG